MLRTFAAGGRYHDRLIYIDPGEMTNPVALNPLRLGAARMASYTPRVRELLRNKAVAQLTELFGTVLGAGLVGKQEVYFRYCVELLLAMPDATIITLRDVLEHPENFQGTIASLDGEAREFWESQAFKKSYAETRDQITRRLWRLAGEKALSRLLSAKENKLDWFSELAAGRVILVDTNKSLLQPEGSAILARMVVAFVLRAAYEREAIPIEQRRPCLVVIDEAHDVVDGNVEDLITAGRKYRTGCLLAHQHLGQLPLTLQRSLAGQVAVKMIGACSSHDARTLAADMGVSEQFLTGARKTARGAEWSLTCRNEINEAVRFEVPFGAIDREPQMSDAEWTAVETRMLARYGAAPVTEPSPGPRRPDPAQDPPKRKSRGKTGTGFDDDEDWASR